MRLLPQLTGKMIFKTKVAQQQFRIADACLGSGTDILRSSGDVRFTSESGHRNPGPYHLSTYVNPVASSIDANAEYGERLRNRVLAVFAEHESKVSLER